MVVEVASHRRSIVDFRGSRGKWSRFDRRMEVFSWVDARRELSWPSRR